MKECASFWLIFLSWCFPLLHLYISDSPICARHFRGEVWPYNRRLLQKGKLRSTLYVRRLTSWTLSKQLHDWLCKRLRVPFCLSRTASRGRWAAMYAWNPGHSWNSKSRQTRASDGGALHDECKQAADGFSSVVVYIGTVHGHEGPVHEEWPRFCFSVLHHSAVDI